MESFTNSELKSETESLERRMRFLLSNHTEEFQRDNKDFYLMLSAQMTCLSMMTVRFAVELLDGGKDKFINLISNLYDEALECIEQESKDE